MPLFGFFWLTSWIGCFLAYNQGLLRVPEYRSPATPSNIFSVVGSSLDKAIPQVPLQQPQSSIWFSNYYRSAGYTLNFQGYTPGQLSSSKLNSTQFAASGLGSKNVENTLCAPMSEQKVASLKLPATYNSASALGRELPANNSKSKEAKSSFPKKVLHMVQNLFHWHQEKNDERSPVTVVSINSQNQVTETTVIERPRAQVGFWRYSQWLSGTPAAAQAAPAAKPELFQIRVKGHLMAEMSDQQQAQLIAQQVANLLQDQNLDTAQLQPALINGLPGGKWGDRVLFVIDDNLAKPLESNRHLLAIEWINNLRTALGSRPLTLIEAQSRLYGLVETTEKIHGITSWYGDYFQGRLTANGETYNQDDLTAAHPSLPFNTFLKVKNLESGESVIVRVNDRGPYIPPRSLDLSRVAARCIKSEEKGVVPFEAVIMKPLATPKASQL